MTKQELKREINSLKIEVENLKQKQVENFLIIQHLVNQSQPEKGEFLNIILKNNQSKMVCQNKNKDYS